MKKAMPRVLISVLFLVLLFYFIRKDLPQVRHTLAEADHGLILFFSLFSLLGIFTMAARLNLIFKAEKIRIGIGKCADLTFIGFFFNNFLPSSVGGDLIKVLSASRVTGDRVRSLTSVLMDRIFGLFVFIMIPSISLLFYSRRIQSPWVPGIVYTLLAISVVSFVLLFNRSFARRFGFIEAILKIFKLDDKARRVYDGLHNFKNHKWVILQAMLLSVVGQSISILVLYGMAKALGARTPVIYFFLLIPVVHLVSMVPVSFGGLGVRESAYVYFLKDFIGPDRAFALGILWLALLVLTSLVGGLIYFFKSEYHIRFGKIAEAV